MSLFDTCVDAAGAQELGAVSVPLRELATGSYWRPFFYLLEARGLACWLVNARDVKNVPGRPKTDKLDAVWLAKLAERGMVRASFVPPKPVRQLRDYTRTRTVFVQERTRYKYRVDKALQDAQIKLSGVVSDLFGMSGRAMLDALVAGERNARTLADLAEGNLVKKKPALIEALTGQFEDHHARLLRVLLGTVDHRTAQIDELDRLIARTLEKITTPPDSSGTGSEPAKSVSARALAEKLDAVPGIGPATAQIILAEIGADMSRFPTPEHLVSWAKLCPRTIQSGAKNSTGPAGQGNPWLKGALGEAANAAARTDTFLGARYRRIVKRRGHAKALVAVARSILAITWHLINVQTPPTRSSASTGTAATSTPPAKPAISSASSRPSATKSPSHRHQPDRPASPSSGPHAARMLLPSRTSIFRSASERSQDISVRAIFAFVSLACTVADLRQIPLPATPSG
ncbi:IS110 family transposase [Streptomyces sp. NPDC006476]|uniref:IS110 family transposase n=1 Tax=Streptomyces sp. NPDC006476 TaxID=3157175 RepID=UPI0033BA3918